MKNNFISDEGLQKLYNCVKITAKCNIYLITWERLLSKLQYQAKIFTLLKQIKNTENDQLKSLGINVESNNNKTLLSIACESNDINLCKWLIANGASVCIQDKPYKNTPLHLAAKNGNEELIQLLIENIDSRAGSFHVNIKNCNNETPLYLAIKNGNLKCVKLLIKSGSVIDCTNNEGKMLLSLAIKHDDFKCVKFLAAKGANVYCVDDEKNTLLHIAASNGSLDCIKFLIQQGISINLVNKEGSIPLHLAIENNHLNCVQYFISQDPCILFHRNHQNEIALHLAARSGSTECVASIIDGIMIFNIMETEKYFDYQNIDGDTPLHLAAKKGYSECIGLLLMQICPGLVNKNKKTALHLAVENQYYDSTKLLIKKMSESYIDKKDDQEKTALDYVKANGTIEVLEIFKDYYLKQKEEVLKSINRAKILERYSNLAMLYLTIISPVFDMVAVELQTFTAKDEKSLSNRIINTIVHIKTALSLIPAFIMVGNAFVNKKLNTFNLALNKFKNSIQEITELIQNKAEKHELTESNLHDSVENISMKQNFSQLKRCDTCTLEMY